MTSRPSTAAPILAVLAIGLGMLGAYVGEYFWLGQATTIRFTAAAGGSQPGIERRYERDWLRQCFEPAAWAEAKLGGYSVLLIAREDAKAFSP